MGIHNRDYIRDEPSSGGFNSGGGYGRGFGGGSDAWAIKRIVIACVVVFLLQNMSGGGLHQRGGITEWLDLTWTGLTSLQLWRVLTYGFCHADLAHIFFNMFGLWIFGRLIEVIYGSRETLAFFLVTVGVSGLTEVVVQHFSGVNPAVIGASGGVFGVIILTALHYPRTPVQFLFIPFSFELRWLAIGYIALDLLRVMDGDSNIASLAHLSGAAFGYVYFKSGLRITGGRTQGRRSSGIGNWLKSKLSSSPKPVRNSAQKDVRLYEPPAPDQLEAEVDRILEKINRSGRESLTAEENELLIKASERYKNRV
ncbi:MAG: rhomboid family intramembrane serine protease [Planctomycetota bacterium]|jgi:membrane associated rhomboid family serine protease